MDRTLEQSRACTGKIAYLSKWEAEKQVKHLKSSDNGYKFRSSRSEVCSAYLCWFCGFWHVGRRKLRKNGEAA